MRNRTLQSGFNVPSIQCRGDLPEHLIDLRPVKGDDLVRMCEGKGLPHTGDREALIARLVEWEKPQEPETPEPED